jgi:hypothetical protein
MHQKNSAGMMLTNETEHYMQQWNYIKIRQAKKTQQKMIYFHVL